MRRAKLLVTLLSVIFVLPALRAAAAEEESSPQKPAATTRLSDDVSEAPTLPSVEPAPTEDVPHRSYLFEEPGYGPVMHGSGWSVTVDAIVWNRLGTPNVPLLRNYSAQMRKGSDPPPTPPLDQQPAVMLDYTGSLKPATGADILNSRDFEFDYEFGPRLSLTCATNHGFDLELTGFGINHWSTAMAFTSDPESEDLDNGLQFDAPGFAAVGFKTPMQFEWESRLYSAEINARWFDTPWMQWLAGFRYVQFDERLQASFPVGAPGVIVPNPVLIPNLAPSDFWVSNTSNHLFGGQVGMDICFWNRGGPLAFSGILKGGLYYNRSEQTSSLPGLSRSVTAWSDDVAVVGETGVQGAWQIADSLSLRLGWQLLVVEGVAMAPSQISVNNVPSGSAELQTKDTLLFHGLTAGLELRF